VVVIEIPVYVTSTSYKLRSLLAITDEDRVCLTHRLSLPSPSCTRAVALHGTCRYSHIIMPPLLVSWAIV